MHSVVRIHPVRANQLEKFASKNSMTVPRLIDWFVRILIDNEEIDDQIEEFTLDCDKDQNVARITLAGHQLPEISLLHASKLVLDLFDFAKDPSTPLWQEVSGTQVLTAHRSGHGVRISLREGQKVLAGLSLSIPILVDVLRGFHPRLSAAGV